jgi:hypothetical protein
MKSVPGTASLATQTVRLKDIKEYFPITFDSPLNTLKNNSKKQEENE